MVAQALECWEGLGTPRVGWVWSLGVSLSILASLGTAFGIVLQKCAHNQQARD